MKHLGILLISLLLMTACGGQNSSDTAADQKQTRSIQKSRLLDSKDFKAAIETDSDYYLLDVRTPEEYNAGTIMNAKNIDFYNNSFQSQIDRLDKDKTVYLFCHSDNRSGKAAKILKDKGFQDIVDLKGGIVAWRKNQ